MEFKEHKIEKIASNGGSICNRVHSLTNYNDHAIAFSDTGDCKVKVINPATKECFVLVGDGQGTRDGSKAQLSQPTGICFDMKTLFTVDTSTGALRMTSSVNSLVEYLKYLHLFGETFGLHLKKEAPLAIEMTPAIERLELVYRFDQECVDNVKLVTGTHGETQGPQGTVSSVVNEDERRLLKSLREIKVLLDRFSPGLSARFNIKSILTLVVENTFCEMRTGASDMPLQLEFDYRFSRAIKERLKRQCSTPYSYFTSSSSYYPHTFVSASYSDLPKLRPPKTNKLTSQQVREMRNWRAVHGQSVPQKTVRNMTTKDNPGTLPINLYAVGPPDVQPLDLTKLGDHHSVQQMPQKEVTEFLYTSNQIVCVKHDKGCPENTLVLACLQENVKVGIKKVMAKIFCSRSF